MTQSYVATPSSSSNLNPAHCAARRVQPLPHNCERMEASTLKRVLDFRLVYDCLADSRTGLVCVDTLLSIWPSDNKLPRDCERFLRQKANPEGFVNWEGFSSGLVEALRADEERLKKRSSKTSHLDKNPSYMQAGNCVATVTSGEIERFLSSCNSGSLVKALAKAGRDVHRWQVSIHKQNSTQKIKGIHLTYLYYIL